MLVKARATKEIFHRDDFFIIAFVPYHPYPSELQLSEYMNFTCKGALSWVTIGQDYEMNIDFVDANRYGVTYKINSVPSMQKKSFENLSRAESFEILRQCTTSDTIANNILDVYPTFIHKILTEGKESIDVKKIKGVGEVYLSCYERELTSKYKYFKILMDYSEFDLNVDDCKKLYSLYENDDNISKQFTEYPYNVLCVDLERSFGSVDKILKEKRKDLNKSVQRCTACIMDILNRNEYDGNTRILGNDMFIVMRDEYNVPELLDMVVDTCKESNYIFYDEKNKYIAKASTYGAECRVAQFVQDKLNSSPMNKWDYIDTSKYKNVDGFEISDEQLSLLDNVCNNDISLLTGSAGCVDAETEFFDGKQWKSIADYQSLDKVLQYNEDGTAELVYPLKYVKEPCDKMYHFETKYGLNQTLSGEHRIIYKGMTHSKVQPYLSEMTMEEMYDKHINGKGFMGKFVTTFNYGGDGIDLTDEEIRLMVATIADGSFYNNVSENANSYKTCRFHIKKERKKERLRKLFTDANLEWRESESSAEGYTDLYYTAPRREKEFSEYWYNCNNHQLQVICDEVFYWDGYVSETKNGKTRKRFSTNVKQNADFIQFALSACGYRSVISANDRRGRKKIGSNGKIYIDKTIEYNVSCTERIYSRMATDHDIRTTKTPIEVVKPIDGYKYCFQVPSSMLVLRRKGKIFITGNCGKTSCVKALIKMLDDYNKSYTLLSFSGKASRVLSKSTNRTATTIHLKCLRDGEIDSDVILIDEFTMTSLDTFCMLLSCVTNENAKFIFVGDVAQLPAISLGKLFKDMLDSGKVPTTTLTKIFRYSSNGMLYGATNTRQGRPFLYDDIVKNENNTYKIGNNFEFIALETEQIKEEVVKQYQKLLSKGVKKQDIMICTPMNKGDIGTIELNNTLQAEFNPPKPNELILTRKYGQKNIVFRVGDIVLNCKNDYKAVSYDAWQMIGKVDDDPWNDSSYGGNLTEDDVADKIVMNGQLGVVREIIENEGMLVQFDEDLIFVNKGKINHMLLGYAISVHRSQGSTVNYTINIISEQHSRMLNRNLEYVAITRSREKTICIGNIGAFDDCLRIEANDYRDTYLKDLLLSIDNVV